MSQPFAVSLNPFTTSLVAPSYEAPASSARSTLAKTEIADRVTLSQEAIAASASSNVLAFPEATQGSVLTLSTAQTAFQNEFPLQHMLDEGYSLAEATAYFDLPLGSYNANFEVHTFDSAA